MKLQPNQAPAMPSRPSAPMIRTDRPAITMTNAPAIAINGSASAASRFAFSVSANWNKHHAELRAYRVGLRKDVDDLMWCGGSRNVIVGGFAIEDKVADAATDEVCGVSVLAQCVGDAEGFNRFVGRKVHVCVRG